ncbi:MAG TPA: hypothetical protein PLZ57_10925 [Pseudobdellovibrionaceae bacterium]|nr:hypothetical protein [Pseudobdellovibrionaceae bacterium]
MLGRLTTRGISLVELLIYVSMMGVIALTMAMMLDFQQKQVRFLSQKQDSVDLKQQIMRQFSNPDVCNWQMSGLTFNSATPNSNIPIATLYSGTSNTSPVLAQSGEFLPGSNYKLRVASIALKDLVATGVAEEFQGFLEITFDASTMASPLQPLCISQNVRATSSPPVNPNKTIVSCDSTSVLPTLNVRVFNSPGNPANVFRPTQTGIHKVTIVGAGGGGGDGQNTMGGPGANGIVIIEWAQGT